MAQRLTGCAGCVIKDKVLEVQAALAESGSSFDAALLAEVVQRDAGPAPVMSSH